MGIKVYGADTVIKNMNKEIVKIKTVTSQRLLEVGLLVKGRSMKITPVDKGNLYNSAYSNLDKTNPVRPFVEIGYTASYAVYVHEMPETYNFTKPGTGPKFLERALNESIKEIIAHLNRPIV
jgi:hypothetical protein